MQKTDFAFEILIHDDASTDGTADIIREYEKKYPDLIKPIYQVENQYSKGGGISIRFNFPRAEGKYIALCEGDDYWIDPFKLQKQVDFLEANPEYGLCYTDVDFLYQESKEIKKAVFESGIIPRTVDFEDHLIKKGYLAPCTWVFRKELVKFFDVRGFADGSFAILLDIFKNSKLYFLNKVTTVYRISKGSASRPKDERKTYFYEKGVFEVQKSYISKYDVNEKISRFIYSDAYFRLIKDALLFEDQSFVDEAKNFFFGLGLNADGLVYFCHRAIRTEEKLHIIQTSKFYKISNFFLSPLYLLKDKISKK